MQNKLSNTFGFLAMLFCCLCLAACGSEKEEEPEQPEENPYNPPELVHISMAEAQEAGYYPIINIHDEEGMTAPILDTNIVEVDLRNEAEYTLNLLGAAEILYKCIFSTSKKWPKMTPNEIIHVLERNPLTGGSYYWVFRPHTLEIDNVKVSLPEYNKVIVSRTATANDELVEAELTRVVLLQGGINLHPTPVHMLIYQTDEGKRLADERIATGWSY